MEKIQCECGHSNPFGTSLCEKCGRPLTQEEQSKKIADMRYDGTAIRSKTYNKSFVDKVWNFFSSVKVGITLIILNLIAASIGTILPQKFYVDASTEPAKAKYYADVYGTFGKIYYELGLADIYSSWWFQILVGMLAISIIVASIDRGIPLHKSLKNQRVKRHESFMKRQRIVAEGEVSAEREKTLELIEEKMKQLKYKVRREDNAILAEKNRFARYGPYINHVGLIIFLVAVMLRIVPGVYVDESFWVREGQIRAVPGMDGYFIRNDKFILDVYGNTQPGQGVNAMAKNYQTNVTLFKQPEGSVPGQTDNLEEVDKIEIRVNHPLKHEQFSMYQMDYSLNELKGMVFQLTEKATGKQLGEVNIDLTNPQEVYELGKGTRVELISYLPDFDGFKDGVPQTKTPEPNNPAFIFRMITPETPEGETSFVKIRQTIEPLGETKYKMEFQNIETRNASGLVVRKDLTVPGLFVGGFIFMLGVVIGSYFGHRRIWIEQLADGSIRLAAHTNKNWFGMRKDLDAVTAFAHLPAYIDQAEIDFEENDSNKKGDEKS